MTVTEKRIKRKPNKQISTLIIILIFGLFMTLSLIQESSPKPVLETAQLTEFSAERAMKHVREIAKEPHPTGSEAHERVIAYIISEMQKLGVEPVKQELTREFMDRDFPVDLSGSKAYNIIGKLPGTNSSKAIMLTAHHDSVKFGPGANDDAVGVAALLETLRALKASPPLQNDVVFLITDAEEIDLLGARAYWNDVNSPYRNEIGMLANFETRGTKGSSLMFQTSRDNGWLVKNFAKTAQNPVSSSLMGDVYAMLPNDTDMTISNSTNISGINFAFGDGWTGYHTTRDNVDNVSLSTLQHHGVNALQVANHFGNIDISESKEPDRVYFNLFGKLIHYPKSSVILLSSLIAIMFLYALVIGLRKKVISVNHLLIGMGGVITAIILSIGINYGLWYVVDHLWAYKLKVRQGAIFYNNWFELSFLFMTFGICYTLVGWIRKKISLVNFWVAGQFIWVILLMVISIYLPGGSYLFMFPLFIQLIILIIALRSRVADRVIMHPVGLLFIASVPILLWTFIVRMLFVFLPVATNVYVMAIPVLLFAILYPLIDSLRESNRRFWSVFGFAMSFLMLAGTLVLLVVDQGSR